MTDLNKDDGKQVSEEAADEMPQIDDLEEISSDSPEETGSRLSEIIEALWRAPHEDADALTGFGGFDKETIEGLRGIAESDSALANLSRFDEETLEGLREIAESQAALAELGGVDQEMWERISEIAGSASRLDELGEAAAGLAGLDRISDAAQSIGAGLDFPPIPSGAPYLLDPVLREPPRPHQARDFYEVLKQRVQMLEQALAENQQLVMLHSDPFLGPTLVRLVVYESPELITIEGTGPEGNPRVILAHVQSLQVTLSVETVEEDTPRRELGFVRHEYSGESAE